MFEFNATFLVSAISFIVFVFIMNTILYRPLEKIVEKRRQFIDDTNLEAKCNFDESEKILNNKTITISDTKLNAKKFISESRENAQKIRVNLQYEAKKNSFDKIENAKVELQQSKNTARDVLVKDLDSLIGDISAKILG
ncbi:hypothetical protein IJ732_05055 [bacterium]|nr:hypothetical protein [bacterium]